MELTKTIASLIRRYHFEKIGPEKEYEGLHEGFVLKKNRLEVRMTKRQE